jgi:beta-lactamase class A
MQKNKVFQKISIILLLLSLASCSFIPQKEAQGTDTYISMSTESPSEILQEATAIAVPEEAVPSEVTRENNSNNSEYEEGPRLKPFENPALSFEQRELIYNASMKYVASSVDEAVDVVNQLDFVENGSASNMCAPLAIAIQQDAGLVEPYYDLNDFWLLNPRPDQQEDFLERVFPHEKYDWIRVEEPVNEIDYVKNPLMVGDILYLYGGSFEHVITISRIEDDGKTYAVSNVNVCFFSGCNTDKEYIIQEILLFDPNTPGEGMFYEWTNPKNIMRGRTGLKGYQLWRLRTPIIQQNDKNRGFAEAVDAIIGKYGGRWHVQFQTLDGDIIYSRQASMLIHPASIIKVPISMLLFTMFDQVDADYQDYLQSSPLYSPDQRSYEQLLNAMLINSEEDATEILLRNIVNPHFNINEALAHWGLKDTRLTPRSTTVLEMTKILSGLYKAELVSVPAREIILKAMEAYTPNDELRLGVIRKYLSKGEHFYNKRGTLTSEFLIVADAAIVETADQVYILQIYGYYGDGEVDVTNEDLEAAIEEVAELFSLIYLQQ